MNIIIKNARIIQANNPLNNQELDIQIHNGIIQKIGKNLPTPADFQEITDKNLHVSVGWFDTSVSLGEPGFEDTETISNGLQTAAKSGFTGIALQPNNYPVTDNQSQVYFVQTKAQNCATQLYPIGALTQKSQTTHLAEMLDMKNAGAVAFGDYNKNIDNANLLKIALQYAQDIDTTVICFSQDTTIKGKGIVNEGINATQLGLKGIPALAEELMVARNLFILEYTGGKLHLPTITSQKSLQLIQQAKQKGLQVTCSVAVHNLFLTDDVLSTFDTNYLVNPPIGTQTDREALLQAVLDNTIDCITTDHNPIAIESKKIEFDLAKPGTIGLESAYPALQTLLPTSVIIDKLTYGRTIFGIQTPLIAEGEVANITLFTPEENWIFNQKNCISKSKNSAFLNQKMQGRVYGIYNKKQLILA